MKIKEIRAVAVNLTPQSKTQPRTPKLDTDGFIRPMARSPEFNRADWGSNWTWVACVITAEDGTWELRLTNHSGPVLRLINDRFLEQAVAECRVHLLLILQRCM